MIHRKDAKNAKIAQSRVLRTSPAPSAQSRSRGIDIRSYRNLGPRTCPAASGFAVNEEAAWRRNG